MGIGVEMGTVCLIDFVSDLFVIYLFYCFLGNIHYKYIYIANFCQYFVENQPSIKKNKRSQNMPNISPLQ